MFSKRVSGTLPKQQQHVHMSYMYGPHMSASNIYFGGDNRVVSNPDLTIELKSPPAWLVADWLLAKKRGEPLSIVAEYFLEQPSSWNRALHWLNDFLNT